jgi:hypothetical protein
MDLICHRCGEPWELDYFHDVAADQEISFEVAVKAFRKDGCVAVTQTKCCEVNDLDGLGLAISDPGDLLGPDVDGFAALVEDMGLI